MRVPWGRALFTALLILSFADFSAFCNRAARIADIAPDAPQADAVLALTGGGRRISEAASLAKARQLPLFISGAHPDSPADDVAAANQIDASFMACCVTLGRNARTTTQNGQEIAAWARAQGYDEFVLVTSHYHIDRALSEAQRALPEAIFHGYAVASPLIDAQNWWRDGASFQRMLLEWSKWRVISLRDWLQSSLSSSS